MDLSQSVNDIDKAWQDKRGALDKSDIAYIANKNSVKGKLLGFMTSAYYKRTKLIENSTIVPAYVFQDWSNDAEGRSTLFPTWLLFSPSKLVNQTPSLLKKAAENLQQLKLAAPKDKNLIKLRNLINEPLSDCAYIEIPSTFSENQLVYLSIVYVNLNLSPSFHLGYNLILMNSSVSSEVLYFPEKYWPGAFLESYRDYYLS